MGAHGLVGDIFETVFYSAPMVNSQKAGVWVAWVVILEPGAAGTSKNCDFGGF